MPGPRSTFLTAGALVGRTSERAMVEGALDAAEAGAGACLTLIGDAGVGKTTLLVDARARARARGWAVIDTACVERERAAGAALDVVLWQLRRVPAAPAQEPLDDGATRGGPGSGGDLLRRLCAEAERQPVLLVVDDLHWADEISFEAFAFAARRLTNDRVVLLGASRDAGRALGTVHQLAPLGVDQSAELLRSVAGSGIPDEVAEVLTSRTGGIPLALIVAAEELSDAQLRGTRALPATLPVGDRLRDHFASAVARLGAPSRLALSCLAHARESELEVHRALKLLGLPAELLGTPEIQPFLDHAGAEPGWRFRHPLVREVAADHPDPAATAAVHRALATAASSAVVRATHLVSAAETTPSETIDLAASEAITAGIRSAVVSGDLLVAADLLLRTAPRVADSQTRCEQLLESARLRLAAGADPAPALEACDALDGTAVFRIDRALLHMQAALFVGDRVRFDAHRARLQHEAPSQTPARRALLEAFLVARAWWDLDGAGIARHHARLEQAYGVLGDGDDAPMKEQLAPMLLAARILRDGSADEHGELLREVLTVVSAVPYAAEPVLTALFAVADTSTYVRVRDVALGSARRSGFIRSLGALQAVSAVEAAIAGRALESHTLAQGALELAESLTTHAQDVVIAHLALALLAARRAAPEVAERHIEEAVAAMPTDPSSLIATLLDAIKAATAELAGRPHEALEHYRRVQCAAGRWPTGAFGIFRAYCGPVRCAIAAGDDAAAAHAAAEVQRAASQCTGMWLAELAAARAAAMIAPAPAVAAGFERALAAHRGAESIELAITHQTFGTWLRRQGDPRAQLHLDRASSLAEAADAEALVHAGPVARPAPSSVAVLTPQERLVALRVAAGQSNKVVALELMLSPKTIEMHLTAIYRKLEVTNRTMLARLVAEHGAAVFGD